MTPQRQYRIEEVLKHRQTDLTVLLENVFDPHNISAVMRTCDAVGIQEIYVLNTKIPRHKKWGFRSSSSAAKWLTIHQFEDLHDCINAIRYQYNTLLTTHLSTNAAGLFETDLTKPTALIFGNEHAGVTTELQAMSDGNLIIPQVGMIQSLNISVACAVVVYEAYRQKKAAGHYSERRMAEAAYQTLYKKWELNTDE